MNQEDYYRYKFPYEALAQLAAHSGDPLHRREFALEGDYFKRYVDATSAASLRAAALEMKSLRSIHIGAVFSDRLSLARRVRARVLACVRARARVDLCARARRAGFVCAVAA